MLRTRYRGLPVTRDRECRPTSWHPDEAAAHDEAERRAEHLDVVELHLETRRPGPLAAALFAALLASVFVVVTHPTAIFSDLNPLSILGGAYLHAFEVENRTDEPLWFTPLGTPRSSGDGHYALPVYLMRDPDVRSNRVGDFRVEPGARRSLWYDWDDIDYVVLVIRDREGRRRQVDEPALRRAIADLDTLAPMSPALEEAYRAAQTRLDRGWDPETFDRLRRWQRRYHTPAWIVLFLCAAGIFPAMWAWRRVVPIPRSRE
jgi:hypothetical protein